MAFFLFYCCYLLQTPKTSVSPVYGTFLVYREDGLYTQEPVYTFGNYKVAKEESGVKCLLAKRWPGGQFRIQATFSHSGRMYCRTSLIQVCLKLSWVIETGTRGSCFYLQSVHKPSIFIFLKHSSKGWAPTFLLSSFISPG